MFECGCELIKVAHVFGSVVFICDKHGVQCRMSIGKFITLFSGLKHYKGPANVKQFNRDEQTMNPTNKLLSGNEG